MASVNKVILLGRLGRDPEIRYSTGGTPFANFPLATDYKAKDKAPVTEWHSCVAAGRMAEICGEYLKKGSQVYIEGRLQTREWEDKDGNKRKTTEVFISQLVMLGSKGEKKTEDTPGMLADEDVPF
jgi:single-strand DNA-binding protein